MYSCDKFAQECLRYKAKSIDRLFELGPRKDAFLERSVTGNAKDTRLGVTVIARPPSYLVSEIKQLQDQMQKYAPNQYFYPSADLHMTLLGIAWQVSTAEMAITAELTGKILEEISQSLPPPKVRPLLVAIDRESCALQMVPCDDSLERFRRVLRRRLRSHGITSQLIEAQHSAHINFMRFIHTDLLDRGSLLTLAGNASPDSTLLWQVESFYLSAGAPRYGRRQETNQHGPFFLTAGHGESRDGIGLSA